MGEGFVIYLSTLDAQKQLTVVTVHTPRGIVDMNSTRNILVHRFVNNYTNRVGCGFECAGIKTQA